MHSLFRLPGQRRHHRLSKQLRIEHQPRLLGPAAEIRPKPLHQGGQNRQARILHPVQHRQESLHGLPISPTRQLHSSSNHSAVVRRRRLQREPNPNAKGLRRRATRFVSRRAHPATIIGKHSVYSL